MDKILISLVIGAVFLSSMSLSSFLIKISLVGVVFTIGIPISINYVSNKIKEDARKKEKTDYSFNRNYRQPVQLANTRSFNKLEYESKNTPVKVIKDEDYILLRQKIIACSQNKVFERIDVLNLKEEIDKLLGSHVKIYRDFEFKNDLHEIYIKLKSNKLNSSSYLLLNNYLNKVIQSKISDKEK